MLLAEELNLFVSILTCRLVLGLAACSFFVVMVAYVIIKMQLSKRHIIKTTGSSIGHNILDDRRASNVSQLWLPPSRRVSLADTRIPSIADSRRPSNPDSRRPSNADSIVFYSFHYSIHFTFVKKKKKKKN